MQLPKALFGLISVLAGLYSVTAASQDISQAPAGVYRNEEFRYQIMVDPNDIACLPAISPGAGVIFIDQGDCRSLISAWSHTSAAILPSVLMIIGEHNSDNRNPFEEGKGRCLTASEPVEPIIRKGLELKGARCLNVSKDVQGIAYVYQRPANSSQSTINYRFVVKFDGPLSEGIRRVEAGIAKFDLDD